MEDSESIGPLMGEVLKGYILSQSVLFFRQERKNECLRVGQVFYRGVIFLNLIGDGLLGMDNPFRYGRTNGC